MSGGMPSKKLSSSVVEVGEYRGVVRISRRALRRVSEIEAELAVIRDGHREHVINRIEI